MIGPGVLVSVRNAREATEALAAGAAVIDVKEPTLGSLGPGAPATIAAVATAVANRVPWTMAAGELATGAERITSLVADVCGLLPVGIATPAAVKAGLAGMADLPWREGLARVHATLPAGCRHVAVAYADFDRARAPAPEAVIDCAAGIGCTMLLIDTADKRGPGLLAARPRADLVRWVAGARAHGLAVVLAGRINIAEIPVVMTFAPDLVALRSAVCSNGGSDDVRLGSVAGSLVAEAVAAARLSRKGDA